MTRASLFALTLTIAAATVGHSETVTLPADVYADKVRAAWLGQCVGNFYGLPHENKYIDAPPEKDILREYIGWPLEKMRTVDGAFSDDDTDIEYMYLFLMEDRGVEPTYQDIADYWIRHINRQIWVANYEARMLMGRGYLPPDTGKRGLNKHWFQIDPQLVNEIWAVTAPGMVEYAAAKSGWAARVTNDGEGTHPTIWYGAMYSAAFFESDLKKVYDIGLEQTPHGRFRDALVRVRRMRQAGVDWRRARRVIKELYYDAEPKEKEARKHWSSGDQYPQIRSIWSATLNGAMGALSLQYGNGDLEETLFLSCMTGFDCDNQAATLAGLMGVAGGTKVLPRKYLYPVEGWKEPFNNRYVNESRDDLPSSTIDEIVTRTIELGEDVIRQKGGQIERDDTGKNTYSIDEKAHFFTGHSFPNREIIVLDRNLAPDAAEIFARVTEPTGGGVKNLKILRDDKRYLGSYDSYDGENAADVDWYGYRWKEPQTIGQLICTTGARHDNGGWWETFGVEYEDDAGDWKAVVDLSVEPDILVRWSWPFRPHSITFSPVETRAIRIVGKPGGSAAFTSIAELEVYTTPVRPAFVGRIAPTEEAAE